MIERLIRRLRARGPEAGLTLIEMLVASTMSVILVGASSSMLITAVKDQPALSKKAQNVTTARWQLERMVREIRNGVKVEEATASRVVLVASMRRTSCGGPPPTSSAARAIECRVTYDCSGDSCTRTEADPETGISAGAVTEALSGVGSTEVFCFVPSTATDPTECGPAVSAEDTTYLGMQLEVPNPDGPGLLTISDGASLRTANFGTG